MKLLNGSGMAAGYTLALDKTGAEYVVVAVKGTFTLPKQGETPRLAAEQLPLVDADQFSGEPGQTAMLVECDYALQKPCCDVLMNGSALCTGRPAGGAHRGWAAGGSMAKVVRSVGQSGMARRAVGYAPSRPEPFERHADLLRQCVRRHRRTDARSDAGPVIPSESGWAWLAPAHPSVNW